MRSKVQISSQIGLCLPWSKRASLLAPKRNGTPLSDDRNYEIQLAHPNSF